MCVCVCVCVYVYVHIYMYIYIHIYTFMHTYRSCASHKRAPLRNDDPAHFEMWMNTSWCGENTYIHIYIHISTHKHIYRVHPTVAKRRSGALWDLDEHELVRPEYIHIYIYKYIYLHTHIYIGCTLPLRNDEPAHFGMWMNTSWCVERPASASHTGGDTRCSAATRRGHRSAHRRWLLLR